MCKLFYFIIMNEDASSADNKPDFGGKYVLVKNENLDQFLVANGTSNEVSLRISWAWLLIFVVAYRRETDGELEKELYIRTYISANNTDDIRTYKSADIIPRYPHLPNCEQI